MADFKIFQPILLQQEGGWCNKAADSGGETWEGISRHNYPNWHGWPIVDRIKAEIDFPATDWTHPQVSVLNHTLRQDDALDALVDEFYKCFEWDILHADQINNQSIANFIVDWAVNAGFKVPVKHAQELFGIPADGNIGSITLAHLNENSTLEFFCKLQDARTQFYLDVVTAHPEDKPFLPNWLERNASFKFQS